MSRSTSRSRRATETKRPSWRPLVALLLGAFSCSTEGDVITNQGLPGEPDQDGTRLRVVFHRFKGEDGARVTVPTNRFFDTTLGTECSFMLAEDDVLRCLPLPQLLLPNVPDGSSFSGNNYFLDSACTQPIHTTPKCGGPAPAYVVEIFEVQKCAGRQRPRVYKLGPVVVPSSLWVGGPCRPVSVESVLSVIDSSSVYPATLIAATEFAKGEQVSVVAQ